MAHLVFGLWLLDSRLTMWNDIRQGLRELHQKTGAFNGWYRGVDLPRDICVLHIRDPVTLFAHVLNKTWVVGNTLTCAPGRPGATRWGACGNEAALTVPVQADWRRSTNSGLSRSLPSPTLMSPVSLTPVADVY